MPVSRELRDAVADAIASFMRGESDRRTMQERIEAIRDRRNEVAGRDEYLDGFLNRACFWTNRPFSERQWEGLCRHLAFLSSGLEGRKFRGLDYDKADRPRQVLLARWHAAGLAIAAAVSFVVSRWVFVVACVTSSLLYMIRMWRHDRAHERVERAERERLLAFYPFATQEEWLAHRGLLEQHRIPSYDADVHSESPTPGVAVKTLTIVGTSVSLSAFVVMLAFMYVSLLFIWPLWLVVMSVWGQEKPAPSGLLSPLLKSWPRQS